MKNYREMADDVLRRAEEERQTIRRRRRVAALAGVPALCAAVALAVAFWPNEKQSQQPGQAQLANTQAAVIMTDPKLETTPHELPPETVQNDPTEPSGQTEELLHIPAIELPEPDPMVAMDMIGLVVYKGGIYTQAADYYGADAEALKDLLGDYLGHASGTIDEWSTQDEYTVEFASDLVGDVYSIKGYSPEFRICVTWQAMDEDGTPMQWIQILERLNGIDVSTGADIYEQRLHMNGRITGIRYQSYDDWNNGRGIYYPLDQIDGLDAFLEALNEGQLQYVYDDDPGFYRNTRAQTFLYLDLDDGTTVPLRLIEGGWVGYEPMGWYFIQLPAEVFDPVFQAARS